MGIPTASRAWTNFMGEDALLDYYTAASKGSSAAAAHAPHSIPAAVSATPAAAAPRHLPLRVICEAPAGYCAAITRQATPETTEGSSDGQTPETMYLASSRPPMTKNILEPHLMTQTPMKKKPQSLLLQSQVQPAIPCRNLLCL
ncbi:hypothetical protein Pcac1_g6222 [Phytophthora cactorum]|nr:hypothetical protein Pcac1_g6222 [Phytophthora cactorum]